LVRGDDGADFLVDDAGLDRLQAGEGDDIAVSNGLHAGERIELGGGDDVLRLSGQPGDAFRLSNQNFADDSGELTILLSNAAGGLGGTAAVELSLADLTSMGRGATIIGNAGANRITGSGFGDRIKGGDGADILIGGRGPDLLEGGRGADTFGLTGFHASLAADDPSGFAGVTIADGRFTGQDKILIEADADGAIEMVDAVTLDGAAITWANFASKLGEHFGTAMFDEDSPLQGSQGVRVTVSGGEAAGSYLVLDRLGADFNGYQAQHDTVVRLQTGASRIDASDFAYLRSASGQQDFDGVAGNRDVLDYSLRVDGSALLSGADLAGGLSFAGEDRIQLRASEFGGLTRMTASTLIEVAAGADLSLASGADETAMYAPGQTGSALSAAIAGLVESHAGAKTGAYFALVYDTDAANAGAGAATYLVFDADGTDAIGTVGGGAASADITVIARFDGLPGALDLDAADFWFDRDLGLGAQDGVSAADIDPAAPTADAAGAQPAESVDAFAPPVELAEEAVAEAAALTAADEHAALVRWFFADLPFEI
jgi:hypothetical protein